MDLGFMRGLRDDAATRFRSTREMDAAELLLDCLRAGEPIVVMTGAAGIGKTTVLNMALDQLGPTDPRILRLDPPFPAPSALQQRVGALLGLTEAESIGPAELARALRALPPPAEGVASLAVIVDAAESVPLPVLQYLWLMHTVAWVERPALQLILAGRDALWRQLGEEKLAGLRRGVSARLALQPFPADEAAEFLQYLLRQRRRRAEPDAVAEILKTAAGVPGRLIALLDSGLPGRRTITLGGVQSALDTPRPVPAPVEPPVQPAAQIAVASPRARLSARLPLQLSVAAAGVVVLIAAWEVLHRGAPSPQHDQLRTQASRFADVVEGAKPPRLVPALPPRAPPLAPIASLPRASSASSRPAAAVVPVWSMPDAQVVATGAASLFAESSRVGSLLGTVVQQADRSLADALASPLAAVAMQTLPPQSKPAAAPSAVPVAIAAPVPVAAPAMPPPSSAGSASALPMLVMADTTAAHVVLEYPEGDRRAETRAQGAVAALREAGVDAADPVAVGRRVGHSAVKYFFMEDRESAKRIAHTLGGTVGRVSVDESLPQAVPPAPGMLEVVVAGF